MSRRYYGKHTQQLVAFLVRRPPPRTLPYFKFFWALKDEKTHKGFQWPSAQDLRVETISKESLWSQRTKIMQVEIAHDGFALMEIQSNLTEKVGSCFDFKILGRENLRGQPV